MTNAGSKSGRSCSSPETATVPSSRGAKSIPTTDSKFETAFRANGGVSALRASEVPPSNKQEVRAYISQDRGSASPTSSQHRKFLDSLEAAFNERDIENLLQGRLFKDTNKTNSLQDIDYRANVDKQWIAFPKNVGFNNGLSAPTPDLVEGYAQRTFPPSIQQLGGSATLIHDHSASAYVGLPHFAAEFKDFGKNMREAEVQAGYDGAHMLYARNEALAHIEDKDPPLRASPMTVTSDGYSWRAYSHYAHQGSETDTLKYYQVCEFPHILCTFKACLGSNETFNHALSLILEIVQNEIAFGRTIDYDDFKHSYKTLRNVQDWARKESDDLRDRLRRHEDLRAKQASATSQAGSVNGGKAGSSAYSSGPGGAPRAPSIRASDAGSRRFDYQASSPSSPMKSAERPSLPAILAQAGLAVNRRHPCPRARPCCPLPADRAAPRTSGQPTRGPSWEPIHLAIPAQRQQRVWIRSCNTRVIQNPVCCLE